MIGYAVQKQFQELSPFFFDRSSREVTVLESEPSTEAASVKKDHTWRPGESIEFLKRKKMKKDY